MLPEPKLLFQQLQIIAGTEGGAREYFQLLITDLVKLEHPTAGEVEAPGGHDWGIDTYFGSFDDSMVVWQCKFFLEWTGETQRKQVRDSFKQIVSKAKDHGIRLDAWILCIPINLPPEEQKWFDTWSAKQRRDHGVSPALWSGSDLRHKLLRPDADHVYRKYFEAARPIESVEDLAIVDDLSEFDDALFVRQMHEAGHLETDAARGLFFAADALFRDISARGDTAANQGMKELHLEVHHIWEQRFNGALATADTEGRMAGLIDQVVREAGEMTDPVGIRLRAAHRRGVAHRLVEDARAGWVTHWRNVAAEHKAGRSETSGDPIEPELADSGSVEP